MTTDSQIYCLKCRTVTPNEDLHVETITTKGKQRTMQKAKCSVRGKIKNRFIKNAYAITDILNNGH